MRSSQQVDALIHSTTTSLPSVLAVQLIPAFWRCPRYTLFCSEVHEQLGTKLRSSFGTRHPDTVVGWLSCLRLVGACQQEGSGQTDSEAGLTS